MMLKQVPVIYLLILSSYSSTDFCYDKGHCGPYAWGDTFPSCHPLVEGLHSPINLDQRVTRDDSLGTLRLVGFDETQQGRWMLTNDGHSLVLEVGSGMSVSGNGLPGTYETTQLHFHWGSSSSNGSEHTVDQLRFPMEMHIVSIKSIHPNLSAALEDSTGLAVLGFFIDVAYAENLDFRPISNAVPSVAHKGQTVAVRPFPLLNLLPQINLSQYYRYHGSLTTPPCSQVVIWTVYEVPISISWAQLEQFTNGIYSTEEGAEPQAHLHDNYRHTHPTFSRTVYASRDARLLTATGPRLPGSSAALALALALVAGLSPGLGL